MTAATASWCRARPTTAARSSSPSRPKGRMPTAWNALALQASGGFPVPRMPGARPDRRQPRPQHADRPADVPARPGRGKVRPRQRGAHLRQGLPSAGHALGCGRAADGGDRPPQVFGGPADGTHVAPRRRADSPAWTDAGWENLRCRPGPGASCHVIVAGAVGPVPIASPVEHGHHTGTRARAPSTAVTDATTTQCDHSPGRQVSGAAP